MLLLAVAVASNQSQHKLILILGMFSVNGAWPATKWKITSMFQYKRNNQRPLNLILMNREIILSSMVWVASAAVSLAASVPTNLKSIPIVNPLGLSLNEYSLSWKTGKRHTESLSRVTSKSSVRAQEISGTADADILQTHLGFLASARVSKTVKKRGGKYRCGIVTRQKVSSVNPH
jgi:hypothetical protein